MGGGGFATVAQNMHCPKKINIRSNESTDSRPLVLLEDNTVQMLAIVWRHLPVSLLAPGVVIFQVSALAVNDMRRIEFIRISNT